MSALISVLMPTRDGAAFVEEAIDSVLGQPGVDLELVVTDDGSVDGTPAIVERLARRDPRVRLATQPTAGAAAARNACLARARGDFVTLLDQDDRCPAGKLARQLRLLEAAPEVDAVFGLTRQFGVGIEAEPAYTMLLAASLLRRAVFDTVAGFDVTCGSADDLDFLLRLLESEHRVELEPGLGTCHRRHPGQVSADRVATRAACVRALARSLARRRRVGQAGPLRHPLIASVP